MPGWWFKINCLVQCFSTLGTTCLVGLFIICTWGTPQRKCWGNQASSVMLCMSLDSCPPLAYNKMTSCQIWQVRGWIISSCLILLLKRSIWPIDGTLIQGQSRPRSNGNEGILHTQAGASQLDVSNPGWKDYRARGLT